MTVITLFVSFVVTVAMLCLCADACLDQGTLPSCSATCGGETKEEKQNKQKQRGMTKTKDREA